MKVEITKCYLVQVLDEEGNELACEYVFDDKQGAVKTGRELKRKLNKEMIETCIISENGQE